MKTTTTNRMRAATAGAAVAFCLVLSVKLYGQTSNPWTLVDDFQYISGQDARANGVGQDVAGNIYVVGYAVSNGVQRALTRMSNDGGASWKLVDDFVYPGESNNRFFKVSSDAAGNVFVVGWADAPLPFHWIVRRSHDGGATWTTVEDYQGPGNGAGGGAFPTGILAQNAGGVYVVGMGGTVVSGSGKKANYANDWIVRRSLDGGTTWTTVDDYEFAPGVSGGVSQAQAVTAANGGFFAVGFARNGGWIVRRSSTGNPATWSTVDVYTDASAFPYTAGTDANGYVYAAGTGTYGTQHCSYSHWLVRRSTDGGQTWAIVDNLGPQAGTPCGGGPVPASFTLDSVNNIVMVGSDSSGNGVSWLTRTSSTGNPGTWMYYPASGSQAVDICRDIAGNLFAVGTGSGATGPGHWLTRKQLP